MLVLRYLEDLSEAQVAEALGCSAGLAACGGEAGPVDLVQVPGAEMVSVVERLCPW